VTERERNWLEAAAVLLAWGVAIAVIRPRGDFPLNDDWDFAIATWNFARTGHFQFTEFTAVSLRAQVLWGAAWTRLYGQSFEVLRASTLTLAAATILVVHRTLLRSELPRFGRVVAILAFAFHPVFVWAACTYMTEVPFLFASAVSFYCFVRGFHEERVGWVAAGCAGAVVSWFVRQTGVAILLAPLAVALWRRRWREAAVIGSTLLVFVALLLFEREWLAGSVIEFANHFKMWRESSFRLPEQISIFYHYTVFNIQSAALFLLPLTAALVPGRKSLREIVCLAGVVVLLLIRVQSLINMGHPLPYFSSPYCCDILAGNTLVDFGLGPTTLTDVWMLGYAYPFHLTRAGRLVLSYGSVLAGAFLICGFAKTALRNTVTLLAAGGAIFGTLALFGSGLYFDRYALDSAWTMVFVLAVAIDWSRLSARIVAAAVLLIISLFSILSVQEYFAWNRARWAAFHQLRAAGIPVDQIDAGSEPFNYYEIAHVTQRRRRQLLLFRQRPYFVAFRPLPEYEVIARRPFTGWFGWHRGAIYTLRLTPSAVQPATRQ
jgi:hypothetical protein